MSQIAGVVLAGGASARFGEPKQLLDWDGRPMVAHVAAVALEAGLEPVIVVLGCAAQKVQAALERLPVKPVMNWRWEDGLSTSVQVSLAALPPEVQGAIFLQCDQPLITAQLLRRLISCFAEGKALIVHPVSSGQRATPVLFARTLFPELARVTGDQGGRELIARHPGEVATIEIADADAVADIDTPQDYRRLRARTAASGSRAPGQPQTALAGIRHLIVDMDGVLWRGNRPMPHLEGFIAFLHERGIRFVLATNNASRSPEDYAAKLARFGVSVPLECILTAAQATAAYLASREPEGTPVYVLGTEGLRNALLERGFELTDREPRYVVVGWDPDMTWRGLAAAALLIRRGASFIGTNPDLTFPSEEGLVPGNGAQLAALQAATGVAPLVIGKPAPWLYHEAMRRVKARPETTAVVGDRLDTDIAGAARLGLFSILVLSGITTDADLVAAITRPDLVCTDIDELARVWKHVPSN